MKIWKSISSKNVKIFWILLSIAAVANLAIHLFIIRPQLSAIEDLQNRYYNIRKNSVKKDYRYSTLNQFQKTDNAWQVIRSNLPPMVKVSDMISELGSMLEKNGSSSKGIRFKPDWLGVLELWRYSASISVRNQYSEIKKILADIQNSPNLYSIEHLTLNRANDENLVDMKMKIAIYCR